jgi:hypothetical protein
MHGGLLTTMEIKARNMAKRQLEEEQFTDLVHAWCPCRTIRYPLRHKVWEDKEKSVKQLLALSSINVRETKNSFDRKKININGISNWYVFIIFSQIHIFHICLL